MDARREHTDSQWALTDVALVVKGPGLDPKTVTRRLMLQPTTEVPPGADLRHRGITEEGEWRLQHDERSNRTLPGQLAALLDDIEPHSPALHQLQREGHDVYISVYGFAGTGAHLLISEDSLRRISQLNIPLELTPNFNER